MSTQDLPLPLNHKDILDRFVAACQMDPRIVAAFLGGSYAQDKADTYSDLDLYLIVTDEAYEDFLSEKGDFVHLLGEPLFLEDFGLSHGYLFILANGTEGEFWIGRVSRFKHIHAGSYKVLLDKKSILKNAVFPRHEADPAGQLETLKKQIDWFWHELAHFIKAMARGQLWFAYGQLEEMRKICVNLARLKYDYSDARVGEEPYFKIEQALPIGQLSPLQTTYCPPEYGTMLPAAHVIFRFYQDIAPTLAKAHDIVYQGRLERMMMIQMEELGEIRSS